MALVRQRSRSQRRLPLTINTSLPECWGQPTVQYHVITISQLESKLAAEIDRQNRVAVDARSRPPPHNIYVKITSTETQEYRRRAPSYTTSIEINNEPALSFQGPNKTDAEPLGLVAHEFLTRYGVYELAASPVEDHKHTGQFIAVYRRTNVVQVDPLLQIRERLKLQKQAAEGEALRASVSRMKALYGTPNCFLGNTMFRQPGGNFKLASELGVGGIVCLESGVQAQITHANKLPATVQDLVELTTDQASLRIPANHPIETLNGPRVAKELQRGYRVLVGQRIRELTRVRHYEEGAEIFDIRWNPDGPIQAYVLPNYGIQVRGAAPPDPLNLVQMWQQVSADELMAALPQRYED